MGRWFVMDSYKDRTIMWDALGDSQVIEGALRDGARTTDLGQGLPPLQSFGARVIDEGSPRDAQCLLQCGLNPSPGTPSFPNRLELTFNSFPGDPILLDDNASAILLGMVMAFQPWWGVCDPDGGQLNSDDAFLGRPIVGRVTYLSDLYGSLGGDIAARVRAVPSGAMYSAVEGVLDESTLQDDLVRALRQRLLAAGLLLDEEEVARREHARALPTQGGPAT